MMATNDFVRHDTTGCRCLRMLLATVRWTCLLALMLVVGGWNAASAQSPSGARKPNILLIVGDDMGYADVGFQGCKDIPTPHLDALAAAGVRCTNGYVTGPYCSPTRAGLLTGRYQQRFGHEFNPAGGEQGLPTSEKTLADRLKAGGYATGLVGKWHLGTDATRHPMKRGFDSFFGFLGGAHDYFASQSIQRGTEAWKESGYLTDAFAREASAFIKQHKGHPWFLYLAFNAVHTPMQADDPRLAKFSNITDKTRRTYAAMMSAMDDAIGSVRATLAAEGLDKETLVMFISDNGGPVMQGVTVNGSQNTPLRGSKRTTLEGGIRVPFLVAWPGRVSPGVYDEPVIQLDLHATALRAAQVEIVADWKLDGVDLLPFFTKATPGVPHHTLYWRFGSQRAIRDGAYKLVQYDRAAEAASGTSPTRLYRLSDDIGEAKDLADAMPDKVRELEAKYAAWNEQLAKPLWGGGGGGAKKADTPKKNKKKAAQAP